MLICNDPIFTFQGKQGKDIKQMKSFVGKLPGLQKQQAALGLRESSTILRSLCVACADLSTTV